jgi:cell division protein FtsI (penicillin-binding protein 3)
MPKGRPTSPRPRPVRRRVPRDPGKSPTGRLVALLGVMTLGLGGIVFRLVLLQVKDASAYQELARNQRVRAIVVPASRGTIFDRDGEELAMSLPAKAVFADPALIKKPGPEAKVVSRALKLPYRDVYDAMTRPGRFVYIARGVDERTASLLDARHLAGLGFLDESRRYYPGGALAPQVLGFVGIDGTGLAGLEQEYQSVLAGRAGHEVIEADPNGVLIPQGTNVDVRPVPGDDLLLTIDRGIQFQAQAYLAAAVKSNKAKGGTVIAMDPRTGEILAMASYPWFDPNEFGRADPDNIRNRALTDAYEPGSVNKVITAAAALEQNLLGPHRTLSVPDHLDVYGKTFHDAHRHPVEQMSLADIITYSSNVGTIKVARMLGKDLLAEYLDRFGLGTKSGLGFPGESRGILPSPRDWFGAIRGTIPIGQGVAVTPLQMLSVYATLANGGVWIQPQLVRGIVGRDGKVQPAPAPETRQVVSAGTAAIVTGMLAYAVDVGTGKKAQVPGYWVAGKTGTARKPLENARGYSDKYVASFMGFLPAAHPAVVIAAVLDEPATVFGAIAAAPLFRSLARFAMARLRVAPAPKLPFPFHVVSPN